MSGHVRERQAEVAKQKKQPRRTVKKKKKEKRTGRACSNIMTLHVKEKIIKSNYKHTILPLLQLC